MKNPNALRTGPWKLSDLESVKKIDKTVLSTFSCGGGSTMGYKLAGYDVIGCVEIDPKMIEIYKTNHSPKHPYLMSIGDFNELPNNSLPKEFFNLDILDGSPPCSSFSMAGKREKKWGTKTHFREGQAKQVLDDLFFDFIRTVNKLQPKVAIAENVKGLIQGHARGYVKQIFTAFKEIGYDVQLFLLNASCMGVPQRRERTFFIANKIDKKIKLEFHETPISTESAFIGLQEDRSFSKSVDQINWWKQTLSGDSFSKVHPKGSWFNSIKLHPKRSANTLAASGGAGGLYHYQYPRKINGPEAIRLQSFPDDFNYTSIDAQYVCGMSVPPYMMQRIATKVSEQLLDGK